MYVVCRSLLDQLHHRPVGKWPHDGMAGVVTLSHDQIVPGRMSLLVILLLVCINLFNGTPARGVETCLDQFMLTCIFFIVGAIGEYAAVLSLLAIQK